MSTLDSLWRKVSKLAAVSPEQLFLELGSSNTRVILGKKLVFEQATCVAVHQETGAIIAYGDKAQSLIGKTGKNIATIFPIRAGVVAFPQLLTAYIKSVLEYINFQQPLISFSPGNRGALAIPAEISPVERDFFADCLKEAGLHRLRFISQSKAAYFHAVKKPTLLETYCVLSIGGQTVQAAVFSGTQEIASSRVRWGGVRLTEIIQEVIRSNEHCSIGWHEAEKVKKQVAAHPQENRAGKSNKIAIRGKDVVSQVSKTIVVAESLFYEAFEQYSQELLDTLETFFSNIPTELTTSALEQGVFITGGGALLAGTKELFEEHLQAPVTISKQPQLDTIQGLVTAYETT